MSDYAKKYPASSKIGWVNYTNTATPLSAANLNHMDDAIAAIDAECYSKINTKADKTVVNGTINAVTFDEETGVFIFSKVNGTSITINTALEKVAVNFTYDSTNQRLVLTYPDGTTVYVDLSALVQQNEFIDTSTIGWTVGSDGKVTAEVKAGSITGDKLQPDYLSNVAGYAADAVAAAASASGSATLAESYCKGDTGTRTGEDSDNALVYKNAAAAAKTAAETAQAAAESAAASAAADLASMGATIGALSGLFQISSADGHLYVGDMGSFEGVFSIVQSTGHMMLEFA